VNKLLLIDPVSSVLEDFVSFNLSLDKSHWVRTARAVLLLHIQPASEVDKHDFAELDESVAIVRIHALDFQVHGQQTVTAARIFVHFV
jgi:hypothetical protein